MSLRVGVVAGEASGDLLGAGLIRAVKQLAPDAVFEGVAGPEMIAAGCEAWANAEELAVMGLIEPLRHVPRLLRLRRSLRERWQANPPDVFIGIDAPDFNLALERRLRESGIATMHYVSPTIWAWRPGRVRTVARAVDCVLCILPFEKSLYDEAGVRAEFVGHPKADTLSPVDDPGDARRELGIDGEPLVALLPGSRHGEVKRLVDVFATAAARIHASDDRARFVIPVASESLRPPIQAAVDAAGIAGVTTLVSGQSIRVMEAADLVILASGTAVLESALLGKPSIAAYKLAPISAAIVRTFRLLKLDYVTLPNNLTEEPMIPEFLQEDATPEAIADEAIRLLGDAARQAAIRSSFAKLHDELALDASRRSAEALMRIAGHG
ncbi:MAG: lipid-A-disaccharide synthase [Woeseiaceae bacterium]|nr:lipid-A-disaccharide synthase [Woeseiaceae bacterium]